ncbi:MAG: arginine N-succinyltransferase [Phycisphaerales bacterium]|nr:MAG: arginine N-succinyltransferase [Phycisphaerales bacterium]
MFVIRQSKPDDVPNFLRLARMVFFINLPPNEAILHAKVEHSMACFRKAAGVKESANAPARRRKSAGGFAESEGDSELFVFTIEDTETRSVIGTSQVRAHQGGPGDPNWSFRITEKTFRSERLGWGTTHKVGQLYGDETGPSEVGGLIIQPSYRGHKDRPGRLLSFIRFHWIGLHRKRFADRLLAEMMAPISSDGDNVFWDHFGRKFIPVKYGEADRFCQHNRGFIPELLPKDEIYLSLFPLEVQNLIGAVSRETIPARRILESLGFQYRNFVDPFDGGPHLDAVTDDVPLVNATRQVTLVEADEDRCDTPAIVSVTGEDGEFRATEALVHATKAGVGVPRAVLDLLGVSEASTDGAWTPLSKWAGRSSSSGETPVTRNGHVKAAKASKRSDRSTARTPKPASRSSSKPSSKPAKSKRARS